MIGHVSYACAQMKVEDLCLRGHGERFATACVCTTYATRRHRCMVHNLFLTILLSTLPFRLACTRKARVEPMLNCEFLEIVLTSSHEPKGSFSIAFSALSTLVGQVMSSESIRARYFIVDVTSIRLLLSSCYCRPVVTTTCLCLRGR
jgi:hypothetical protein